MIRLTSRLSLTVLLAALVILLPTTVRAEDPVLHGCLVKLQDDVKLPAKEPGVLVQLAVKEGDRVVEDQVVGNVDDSEAQMQRKIAEYDLRAAQKRAEDDAEIRYQQAAAKVAEADYEQLLETNKRAEKAVTQVDIRRAKLDWDRAKLGIEKSQREQELAGYEADTKKVELAAAEKAVDRRTIRAPFNGEVVKTYRQQAEWVSPGDPILRLVRLDAMEVEGAVSLSDYDPHEIYGCDVTVEVELARGRREQARGRITYVSSLVRLDGKYAVRAEVTNRQEHDRWMLRDGMTATMVIHLNSRGGAPLNVSRAP